MRPFIYLAFILIFFSFQSFSVEDTERDSLFQVLKDPNIHDTTRAKTLNDFALTFKNENNDSAIALTKKAIYECEKINFKNDSILKNTYENILVNAYSNLISLHRNNNNLIEAISIDSEIHSKIENAIISVYKANYYSNLANVFAEAGDITNTYNNFLKAREIYELLDNKSGIASTYYNIGKMFYLHNRYPIAIENINLSLNYLKQTNSVLPSSYCFNLLASCYTKIATDLSIKQIQKDSLYNLAIKYYEMALKIKIEYDDFNAQIITHNNLSNTYFLMSDFNQALSELDQSSRILKNHPNFKMQTLSQILYSNVYIELNEIEKAFQFAKTAYENSKKLSNVEYLINSSHSLKQIYKLKKDYKNALAYHEIYQAYKDSVINQSHLQQLLEAEQAFRYKRKSIEDSVRFSQQTKVYTLEMQKKEAELNQKKTFRNWLFYIIISLMILIFFIYKNFKNQVKAKQKLSLKNIHIQQQNDTLEEQKNELKDMNNSLQKAYQDKVDSIKFARRIQATTFPTEASILKALPNSFIIYKPLDIVSGDFYWVRQIEDEVVIAVGDSTGHGVPGAFMSIMGIAILKEMVNRRKTLNAAEIMNDVRVRVIESLQQYKTQDYEQHYGMDLGIIIFKKKENVIQFSGAYTPLYIIKNLSSQTQNSPELIQINADKMPISLYPKMEPYSNHIIQLDKGDMFYMFTDGTVDQFGGRKGKKLGTKVFIDKLVETSLYPVHIQKENIEKFINEWKISEDSNAGEHYLQTDDITILGVRV